MLGVEALGEAVFTDQGVVGKLSGQSLQSSRPVHQLLLGHFLPGVTGVSFPQFATEHTSRNCGNNLQSVSIQNRSNSRTHVLNRVNRSGTVIGTTESRHHTSSISIQHPTVMLTDRFFQILYQLSFELCCFQWISTTGQKLDPGVGAEDGQREGEGQGGASRRGAAIRSSVIDSYSLLIINEQFM